MKTNEISANCETIICGRCGVHATKTFHYHCGKFAATDKTVVISQFKKHVHAKYYYWWLVAIFNKYLRTDIGTKGISSNISISQSSYKNTPIFVPPIEEQIEIADYLDKKTKEIDNLISQYEKSNKELLEFKKSLQKDVTNNKYSCSNWKEPKELVEFVKN